MKTIFFILFMSYILTFCIYVVASTEPNKISSYDLSDLSGTLISDAYQEGDVLISFYRAVTGKHDYIIGLKIKSLSENKIIELGRQWRAIQVIDNFGNDLHYTDILPTPSGNLRPRDEKTFLITFSIKPLDNTEYLLIKIPSDIFGNKNPFELIIKNPVFEPIKSTFTEDAEDVPSAGIVILVVAIILFAWLGIPFCIKLIKWTIHYLKRKSPTEWGVVLIVWIACAVFLMLSILCLSGVNYDEDMSTPFIICSLSIAAVLATVLFSFKKIKGK